MCNPFFKTMYKFTPQMKAAHPSICHQCQFALKPTSKELAEQGYVGCQKMLLLLRKMSFSGADAANEIHSNGTFEQAALGWVNLSSLDADFEMRSLNDVFMSVGCTKCKYYIYKQ